jgi:hypothetical protein
VDYGSVYFLRVRKWEQVVISNRLQISDEPGFALDRRYPLGCESRSSMDYESVYFLRVRKWEQVVISSRLQISNL